MYIHTLFVCCCLLFVVCLFICVQEKKEREMEERILASERDRELKEKQAQQEERLAKVGLGQG